MCNMNKNLKSITLLFLTAFIWGSSFVTQSMGNDYMNPFTFTAARNLLGCVVLLPLVIYKIKKSNNNCANTTNLKIPLKVTVIGGISCGLALTAASLFQQYGVMYTTVSKAGFITTLYIIITPILGIFIKKKCPWTVWIGAGVACVGMYFLCITENSFALSLGDFLTLICAVLFSVHILVVDHFAPQTDGVVLSCIQFFMCFVISTMLALIFDHPTLGQIFNGIIPVLYAGILSSGVGYTFQILGQKDFNPTAAALILSLESVISAISAYFAYKIGFLSTNQTLTAMQIIGCVIVFSAVIFVQLPITNRKVK